MHPCVLEAAPRYKFETFQICYRKLYYTLYFEAVYSKIMKHVMVLSKTCDSVEQSR
jgi:hypothetical protein